MLGWLSGMRESRVPGESGQTPSVHVAQKGKAVSYLLNSKCYATRASFK